MDRRSLMLMIAIVIMTTACGSMNVNVTAQPTATVTSPATDVPASTNLPATLEPVTPTADLQSIPPSDWLSRLEVIGAANWSRLQLRKTFPAEMPLNRSAVAISFDGKTMAVGSSNGAQIFFFDLESGQPLRSVSIGLSTVGDYFNIVGMQYLPDGTLMANSTGPYAIYHMDTDGNILAKWDGLSFALSADKKIMAHIDDSGLTLVDIASSTPLISLEGVSGMDFSISPDGFKIAVEDVGVDYIHTTIWDIPNKTVLGTLDETAAPRYSPDGKYLAVIYYDNQNDRTPFKIFSPDGRNEVIPLNVSEPDDLTNRAPLWSIDGSAVVAQVANGSPVAWDTTNWQRLDAAALQGELYAFSPDGRILVTRAPDGGILLWGVVP